MLDPDHPLLLIYQIGIGSHVLNLRAPSKAQHREGMNLLREADAGEIKTVDDLNAFFDKAEAYVKSLIVSVEKDGTRVRDWAADIEESGLIVGHNALGIINAVLFRGRDGIQVLGPRGAGAAAAGPGAN